METNAPKLRKKFALGGQIVSEPWQAERILRLAKEMCRHWLIPQAESVLRQLKEQTGPAQQACRARDSLHLNRYAAISDLQGAGECQSSSQIHSTSLS